jgi:enterochelin esterase-like enzyme
VWIIGDAVAGAAVGAVTKAVANVVASAVEAWTAVDRAGTVVASAVEAWTGVDRVGTVVASAVEAWTGVDRASTVVASAVGAWTGFDPGAAAVASNVGAWTAVDRAANAVASNVGGWAAVDPGPRRDFIAVAPLGVVLAAAGLVPLVTAIWLLRRRHTWIKGRRTWRATAFVTGTLGLAAGLAVVVNAALGWAPNLDAVRLKLGLNPPTGQLAELGTGAPQASELGSAAQAAKGTPLARPRPLTTPDAAPPAGAVGAFDLPAPQGLNLVSSKVWVYTPPGYDPSGAVAYPVIYLFHGAPGAPEDWIAAGAPAVMDQMIAAGELAPVIAVLPDVTARGVNESACLDSTKPGGSKLETFMYDVVAPWVENHFPVAQDRGAAAVSGMSMGGYCAVDQGLRHRDRFATVLAFMPYGTPGAAGAKMKSTQAEIDAVTPLTYVSALRDFAGRGTAVWFGVPGSEVDLEVGRDSAALAQALAALGQLAEVYVAVGETHSWNMVIASLPEALRFWQSQLDKLSDVTVGDVGAADVPADGPVPAN